MAVQTSYSRYLNGPKPGTESDQARCQRREGLNKTGADLDVGLALVQDASFDSGVDLPSDPSQKLVGISINDMGRNPNGLTNGAYASNRMLPTVAEGPVYVQADQAVGPTLPVFVRYAASTNSQTGAIGSFRADGDGVAQVTTVTPTAADTTVYSLDVFVGGRAYHFAVTSGSGATATTICTLFRTAMAADKRFAAAVTASGTATLVLTAALQNDPFSVAKGAENAGTQAIAYTTAASGTARVCRGMRWLSSATATQAVGELQFSATADSR